MNEETLNQLQARLDAGEADAVLQQCRQWLQQQDAPSAVRLLAANAAIRLKDWQEACAHLQPLLDAQPMQQALRRNLSQCWNNHARQCLLQDRDREAEQAFRKAVQIWPQNVDAGYNYGLLAIKREQPAIARQLLGTCVQLDPGHADAWLELAGLEAAQGRLDAVRHALERLDTLPLTPAQQRRLARLEQLCGRAARARARLRALFEQQGGTVAQACEAAFSHDPVCRDTDHLQQETASLVEGLDWLERQQPTVDGWQSLAWSHFFRAYQGVNHLDGYRRYARWLAERLPPVATAPRPVRQTPRVAMVSSFFRDCTVGHYFASWVGGLVERGFEVALLQLGPRQDAFSESLLARATHGEVVADVDALLTVLKRLAPDIVLYPELGMDARLYPLAAARLAPVQLVAWGHPETTGFELDGFISCSEMEPDQAQRYYSEPLYGLPGLGTAYTPVEPASGLNRADFHLPEDVPLALLPHALFKIHPEADALWGQLARQVPGLQFVLFEESRPMMTPLFLERFHRKVAPERVRVFRNLPRNHYLALNRLCDLMLDNLHFSAGNTALDAISVGLPVITLPGRFMRGRQTAFMLRRLGLDDCVAVDESDYVSKAVHLLTDAQARRVTSETLLRNQPRLFNDSRPLDALAALLQRLWQASAEAGDGKPLKLKG